jgi:20S proteasome subunit beta 4
MKAEVRLKIVVMLFCHVDFVYKLFDGCIVGTLTKANLYLSHSLFGTVVIAADQMNASYGILILQENIDKVPVLSNHTMMGVCGPNCDITNYTNVIQQHIQTYHFQNNQTISLSVAAQANYARNVLSTALRRGPYQVDVLIGGVDAKTKQSSLYWIDYLGTLQKVNYGCQGYCTQFCLSIMDEQYNANVKMTKDDAIRIIQMCINEIQKRFLPQQKHFIIKCMEYDMENTATTSTTAGTSDVDVDENILINQAIKTSIVSFGNDPADN